MANRFLGEVTVEAGGKTYKLRIDWNSMCEFEDATGKDAMATLQEFEGNAGSVSAKDLRTLMWSCMLHHHPEASPRDAGDLLSENIEALTEVIKASMPTAEDVGDLGNGKSRGKKRAA